MIHNQKLLLRLVIAGLTATLIMSFHGIAQQAKYLPGFVQVKFKKHGIKSVDKSLALDSVSSPTLKKFLNRKGFKKASRIFPDEIENDTVGILLDGNKYKKIDLSTWYLIEIDKDHDGKEIADSIQLFNDVESSCPVNVWEPDSDPNDTYFTAGYQTGLKNGTTGRDIHASKAWTFNTGRNDVKIAVVDGGVDYNHIDLDPGDRSRIIAGYDAADNDNDPIDDIPSQYGWASHGTNVAGVIGAITNNNSGIAGIMWNVKIIPVKVAATTGPWWDPLSWTTGSAIDPWIANGITWAKNNGAKVINLSLGGYTNLWSLFFFGNPVGEAAYNAYSSGVLVVAAKGNDNTNNFHYPSDFPFVMAVGATNQNDNRTSFSNYGSALDVVAPGDYYANYSTQRGNQYGYFQGTSCAAPMVSGGAGLVISEALDRGLNLSNDDVQHLLERTAEDKGDIGRDDYYGWGRIDVGRALSRLNLPYEISQNSVVSSNATLVEDSHAHQFYNNGGLASGAYYGTRTYKVTAHVTFSSSYVEPPLVLIRERSTIGWSYATENTEWPWAKITNVTTTGFDLETVIYYVGQRPGEGCICKYWPGNSDVLQATFAYTVIGRREINQPTVFTASALSSSQICLSWQDNSNNEVGFRIERSTDGYNFNVINEFVTNGNGSGTRTYDDGGLTQNITYYYRVRGYAQEFVSSYSVIASEMIPVLQAVTNLSAEGQPMSIKLAWAGVSNAEGYRIYRNGISVGTTSSTSYLDIVPNYTETFNYEVRSYYHSYEVTGPSVNGKALHLASSTPNPTANNNQRKMVRDATGVYHMVYESGGEIWYTKSNDDGNNWINEFRINIPTDEGTNPRNPSLYQYIQGSDNYLQVVWIEDRASGGGSLVKFRECVNGIWNSNTYSYGHQVITVGYNMKPVIERGWVAYDYLEGSTYGIAVLKFGNQGVLTNVLLLPSGQGKQPAIYVNQTELNTAQVVYEDPLSTPTSIQHRVCVYNSYSSTLSWSGNPLNISLIAGRTNNCNPSIAGSSTSIYAAWQGYNSTTGKTEIIVRKGIAGTTPNWNNSYLYFNSKQACNSTANFSQPSIGFIGNNIFGVTW